MPFVKGHKSKGGRPKRTDGLDIKRIVEPYIPDSIGTLIELLTCDDSSGRFKAAKELLDRYFGKPKDQVEVSGGFTVNVTVAEKKK